MQDLNDKITGGTLTANEWNELPSEVQNVIEQTGQTLSALDLNQLGKGVAAYASYGDFYEDSGSANVYVLSVIGTKQMPPAYKDGFRARFVTDNTNTGASTVNVAGLGVKAIEKVSSGAIVAGTLNAGEITELVYVLARDVFVATITASSGDASTLNGQPGSFYQNAGNLNAGTLPAARVPVATETLKGGGEVATQAEQDAGVLDDKISTPKKIRAGFASSFATTGYIAFPSWLGGFIFQWGNNTVSGDSTLLFSWPLAYPNLVFNAVACQGGAFSISDDAGAGISGLTTTQGTLRNGVATSQPIRWFSVGR